MDLTLMPFLRQSRLRTVVLSVVLLGWPMVPAAVIAQPTTGVEAPLPTESGATGSIAAAVSIESQRIEELRAQLRALQEKIQPLTDELNRFRAEASRQESVLALPDPDFASLSNALRSNEADRSVVAAYLEVYRRDRDTAASLVQSAASQIEQAESQIDDIRAGPLPVEVKNPMLSLLGQLIQSVSEKKRLLEELQKAYNGAVERLQEVHSLLLRNAERLDQRIQAQSRRLLFERTSTTAKILQGDQLVAELQVLMAQLSRLLRAEWWGATTNYVKEESRLHLLTFFLLFLIAGVLFLQGRHFVSKLQERAVHQKFPWRMLVLRLLERSVLPGGFALFLILVDRFQFPHTRFVALRLAAHVLLAFVCSRWVLDYLCYRIPLVEAHRERLLVSLQRLAHVARWFAIGYIVGMAMLGPEGVLLFLGRTVFELGLAVWCFRFWRAARPYGNEMDPAPTLTVRLGPALSTASYAIVFTGIFIEAAGYGVLALYWYLSWARTVVLWLWLGLAYMAIREWYQDYGEESDSAGAGPNPDDGLLRWLFIQLTGLAWVVAALVGSFLAWDARGNILQGFYTFIGKPIAIGKVQLSILGLMYALLVLFITYVVTRLGRYLLQEKILAGRNLERGVKDSTTAISVYLLWALGIIVSLGVLGVSTTSLAVVFGALSIGIGFGLQNIFNNFISGIILLIERPIQVGDAVEVNGIWGEVRKINVRSTVVQTYDNASLIIPNSDFISSQVTNWSFKDQRLRRKITVGVAYGSDIEAVRKTLLAIATDTPNVLKYPPPDVHFLDHGDSALIFMLRYWTHVDFFYSTSTDIRFAIDRLFREQGIEIAFPQRDLHIRSWARDAADAVEPADAKDPESQ